MSKVLFTASTFSHIANFHRPYLRAFRTLGWEVHIACGGTERDIPEADRCFCLPLEKSMTSPRNLQAVRMLRRLIRQEDYALLSCHTSLAAFFTRMAVQGLSRRPYVVNTAHGYLFDDGTPAAKRKLLLGAERLTANVTDLLLTMNRWDSDLAHRERLGRQIIEIPGVGVDFSRFDAPPEPSREELRRCLGLSPEHFLLLYAAEFSARKNQQLLLRALPQLPDNAVLLLPGSGALLEDCRALAEQLGIADRVIFPGQVTDMPRWYALADAAVSASRSEGLPFNIMEAMYCRLCVIASDVKGHTDLLVHGRNGLLYPYNDAAAFASCVSRIMEDGVFARALADAAHDSVLPYELSCVLPQVMAAYRTLPCMDSAESAVQGMRV